MKPLFTLLMVTLLMCVARSTSFSQTAEPFRCPVDRIKDQHDSNTSRNNLLDSVCTEIDRGLYAVARNQLLVVLKMDSAANGESSSYLESLYFKLGRLIEEGAQVDNAEPAKSDEPAPQPALEPTPEPVASPSAETAAPVSPVESKEPTPATNPEPVTPPAASESAVAGNTTAVEQTAVSESAPPADTPSPEVEKSATVTETEKPVAAQPGAGTAAAQPEGERSFSKEEVDQFQKAGLQKLRTLELFLVQIADKKTPTPLALKSIDNAVRLFDSEEREVEVSSVNTSQVFRRKIRQYLNKLKGLNYSNVNIEWAQFQYTSDFWKAPDGNYHGYVLFEQRFNATVGDQLKYSDVTRKKAEVILKFYEKAVQGKMTENWEVLLGDIGVVETSRN